MDNQQTNVGYGKHVCDRRCHDTDNGHHAWPSPPVRDPGPCMCPQCRPLEDTWGIPGDIIVSAVRDQRPEERQWILNNQQYIRPILHRYEAMQEENKDLQDENNELRKLVEGLRYLLDEFADSHTQPSDSMPCSCSLCMEVYMDRVKQMKDKHEEVEELEAISKAFKEATATLEQLMIDKYGEEETQRILHGEPALEEKINNLPSSEEMAKMARWAHEARCEGKSCITVTGFVNAYGHALAQLLKKYEDGQVH